MRRLLLGAVLLSVFVAGPSTAGNVLTGNPLIIDTASATALTTKQIQITAIKWVGGGSSAAADACTVTDGTNTIWAATATGANYESTIVFDANAPLNAAGLAVTALTHGIVYIYVKKVPIT